MATEIPDSALKASLSARLRRTGCISNDLFHSDDPDDLIHFLSRMTTPSEALADMLVHPGAQKIDYECYIRDLCSAN